MNKLKEICEDDFVNNDDINFAKQELYYQIGQQPKKPRRVLKNPTLQNQWYPVAASSQLLGDKVVSIQLFCEPIIIYRSSNGDVVAAEDRCPHRSSPLSMANKLDKGGIKCIYHAWSFDNNGKCSHIPNASEAFVSNVSLFTIPCYEHNDIIWIFKGDKNKANTEDIKTYFDIPSHNDKSCGVMESISDLPGDWISVLAHFLDPGHVYFMHAQQLALKMVNLSYEKEAPLSLFKYTDKRGYFLPYNTNQKLRQTIMRYDPPCMVIMNNVFPAGIVQAQYIIPINKNSTRVIFRRYHIFYI